jgi:hypothetical protein
MTNISTERVYYADTYLDKLEVKILEAGQDESGNFVIFDKTIFRPKVADSPTMKVISKSAVSDILLLN